ncbi:transcriptional regulator, TetR family [Lacrimispora sphenoides]|jgi:AcrR family transcriptional regulator|uniref:TetR/AcrR family transcriptional regulator n=1 Tax=Lacrimispora sphenoides TaxID=29370 RepID=UPI0008D2D77F|nr:TetR/AcrR family transcriptional regulator [Lacrimispora sphenoides]SET55032.1 transcriptional regulator, TetR family [Lacrimispora sphenoides]
MKFNDKQNEQRVLEKTAEFLSRRGIRGWNMDELAAESGLAKNTLYRIIGSKEKLIERVVLEYCNRGHSRMTDIIDHGNDYMETLEIVAAEFPKHMNSLYADFLLEVFLEYPNLEKVVRNHRDELTESITEFIRRGVTEGYLRKDIQPELAFELLQAIILFFVKSGLKGKELSEKIHQGFRCLIYGIVVS